MPCGNPHLSNQANHMLTRVIILTNTSAPIREWHLIIFFPSHKPETLTQICHPRQLPPRVPSTTANQKMAATLSILLACSRLNHQPPSHFAGAPRRIHLHLLQQQHEPSSSATAAPPLEQLPWTRGEEKHRERICTASLKPPSSSRTSSHCRHYYKF